MLDPPRQNWLEYERLTRQADAASLRSLTPDQRFAQYSDLFRTVFASRDARANWSKLEEWRWRQKLAQRLKEVNAYRKLDGLRSERSVTPGNH